MANPSIADLTVSALNAMASSPDGMMSLPDLSTHLETRLGSTEEAASDSRSAESQQFQDTMQTLVSGPEGLVSSGYATQDSTGGRLQITPAGRAFVGR